jgi:hypothetical protein
VAGSAAWSNQSDEVADNARPGTWTRGVVAHMGPRARLPILRRMPSGEEITEFRLSVTEAGRRLLPTASSFTGATGVLPRDPRPTAPDADPRGTAVRSRT